MKTVSENICRGEKFCRSRQATVDKMVYAYCIMVTLGYKHTHSSCNTHWFSTTTMVHERASMLRYTCIACRVYISNNRGSRIAPWGNSWFKV